MASNFGPRNIFLTHTVLAGSAVLLIGHRSWERYSHGDGALDKYTVDVWFLLSLSLIQLVDSANHSRNGHVK
jgi:hypothetical protein